MQWSSQRIVFFHHQSLATICHNCPWITWSRFLPPLHFICWWLWCSHWMELYVIVRWTLDACQSCLSCQWSRNCWKVELDSWLLWSCWFISFEFKLINFHSYDCRLKIHRAIATSVKLDQQSSVAHVLQAQLSISLKNFKQASAALDQAMSMELEFRASPSWLSFLFWRILIWLACMITQCAYQRSTWIA